MALSGLAGLQIHRDAALTAIGAAWDKAVAAPSTGQAAATAAMRVQFDIIDAQAALARMLLQAQRSEDVADGD